MQKNKETNKNQKSKLPKQTHEHFFSSNVTSISMCLLQKHTIKGVFRVSKVTVLWTPNLCCNVSQLGRFFQRPTGDCLCFLKVRLLQIFLCGSPQLLLDKLQRVQNSAAKLVMKSCKCDHVQPLLRNLHWLPVRSRIDYKITTLCFNTFTNSSPVYIALLQSVYTPSRHLRSSSDTRTLRIPFVKT